MNKLIRIIFSLLIIAVISEGIMIYQQNNKIKKLVLNVTEINNRADPEVDLSDIESRINDLESENKSLNRKINIATSSTNSSFDAEYENRKLERRIDDLESRVR